MSQSKATATATVVNPNTPEAYLVVEIAVDCPECGVGLIRIPGHHLKMVRDAAISYCDQFPTLTGGAVQLVHTYDFQGAVPQRPEDN